MMFVTLLSVLTALLLQSNSVDAQQPATQLVTPSPLRTVFEWRELEFQFPNVTARNAAITDQSYIPGASVAIDIAVYYNRTGSPTYFVTTPRFNTGRPMTLATIMTGIPPGPGGPFLQSYPDYSWHINPARCEGMVSVYRVAIDGCDRMWVLDAGRVSATQACPPQLLLFDLKTNLLIHRHRFASTLYRDRSVFVNPVADVRDGQCKDTFVYISDVQGFGLIIYDHARNVSWRIDNKLFFPFPSLGTHRIAGEQFELMDGILGMALGPFVDNERYLYFQALESLTINRVATSLIRNFTIFGNNSRASPLLFQVYAGKRPCQSAATAIDSVGTMYFGLNEEISLACWLTSKAYGESNIERVVQDNTTLQFASGVKIIRNPTNRNTEELWLVTNHFQQYMTGTLNNATTNFRILVAGAKQLSRNTVCDPRFITLPTRGFDSIFEPVNIVPDQLNYMS